MHQTRHRLGAALSPCMYTCVFAVHLCTMPIIPIPDRGAGQGVLLRRKEGAWAVHGRRKHAGHAHRIPRVHSTRGILCACMPPGPNMQRLRPPLTCTAAAAGPPPQIAGIRAGAGWRPPAPVGMQGVRARMPVRVQSAPASPPRSTHTCLPPAIPFACHPRASASGPAHARSCAAQQTCPCHLARAPLERRRGQPQVCAPLARQSLHAGCSALSVQPEPAGAQPPGRAAQPCRGTQQPERRGGGQQREQRRPCRCGGV